MTKDQTLRQALHELLQGGAAHLAFDDAVADLPADLRGRKPKLLPHTPWRLVEHLRIAQYDILEFCRNPDYASIDWPNGYWPQTDAPPNDQAWTQSLHDFRADHATMLALVSNPANDLSKPIPWGNGQTVLREAMLLADHNAYHLGQLVTVRRLLGAWDR
jgi:hypothetical protein